MARRIAARLADLHGASPHTFPVPPPSKTVRVKVLGSSRAPRKHAAQASRRRFGAGVAVVIGREWSRRLRKVVLEVCHGHRRHAGRGKCSGADLRREPARSSAVFVVCGDYERSTIIYMGMTLPGDHGRGAARSVFLHIK